MTRDREVNEMEMVQAETCKTIFNLVETINKYQFNQFVLKILSTKKEMTFLSITNVPLEKKF